MAAVSRFTSGFHFCFVVTFSNENKLRTAVPRNGEERYFHQLRVSEHWRTATYCEAGHEAATQHDPFVLKDERVVTATLGRNVHGRTPFRLQVLSHLILTLWAGDNYRPINEDTEAGREGGKTSPGLR